MNLKEINFKSNKLEVVEETQSIVVKDICKSIGLDFTRQYRKILNDETFQSKLIKVQTNGGIQEVFTIPLSKLNGWLFSINPNKVKPEVKEKLIEYKNECFDVLNNYFNKGIAVNERFHQQQISGYKSQLSQRNKKIKFLEQCLKIQAVDYERKLALPNFSKNQNCTLKPHKLGKELLKDFVGSVQKQEEAMEMIINEIINIQKDTTRMKNRFLNNFPEANPHAQYDKALLTKVPYDI